VRIVSTDRDFLQLIDGQVSVYSPVKKIIVDHDNLMEAVAPRTSSGATVEFPLERFLDYRAMVGDPSDNIPGVPGAGPLTAAKLLQSAPIETYFGHPEKVRQALGRKSAALESAFTDGTAEAIHSRNRTLMDLRLPAPCWDTLDEMTTMGTWDRAGFEAWAEEQRFSGLDIPLLLSTLDELASRQH
jgi:5'-3' exonuclease